MPTAITTSTANGTQAGIGPRGFFGGGSGFFSIRRNWTTLSFMPRHFPQWRQRLARRPAFGLVVAQVQPFLADDPADRIAPVIRPSHVVALLADEHVVAIRFDPARAIGCEDAGQAAARGRVVLHHQDGEPRELGEGGRQGGLGARLQSQPGL